MYMSVYWKGLLIDPFKSSHLCQLSYWFVLILLQ